jgi:PiT family inorganic phosphate transporter
VPTIAFIVVAPLIGMIIAFFITIVIVRICKNAKPYKAERWFKRLQLFSSAAFSIGHGGNDAQKVMGIIGAAMLASLIFLTCNQSLTGCHYHASLL